MTVEEVNGAEKIAEIIRNLRERASYEEANNITSWKQRKRVGLADQLAIVKAYREHNSLALVAEAVGISRAAAHRHLKLLQITLLPASTVDEINGAAKLDAIEQQLIDRITDETMAKFNDN